MYLNANPFFFSQLLERVRFTVREFVVNVSTTWPQDLVSAVKEFVVDTTTTSSDSLTPSVHNSLVKRGCDALTVWAPPISFEPPPLPPPPPIDPLFSANDFFPTATFISFPNEVDVPLDWPSSSLVAHGLLGFGVLLIIALSIWTLQGISFDIVMDHHHSEQSGPLQTGFDTFWSVVKLCGQRFVSVSQYTLRIGRQLPRRLLLSTIRITLTLLHRFTKFSIETGHHIGLKLVTVILPSVLDTSLRVIVWLFHQTRKAFRRTTSPTPVLQPEKHADDPPPPQPAPPQQPAAAPTPVPAPPQPIPYRQTWSPILLDGETKVEVSPKDIMSYERIGKGGFAEVFRGVNKANGQQLAIKRVQKKALGEDGHHLIVGEVRIMNRIRDAKKEKQLPFPTLFGGYIDPMHYILAMDLIPGGSMTGLLRGMDGYFDRPLAYFYAAQLLLAIHSLHNLGVIHCDIKPDNILLDAQGNLILTDFGVAKAFDLDAEGGDLWNGFKDIGGDWFPFLLPVVDDNPHLLQRFRGTEFYAAPETNTHLYSYGVDYWSWAATFFQLLTGILPWAVDDEVAEYVEPMEVALGYNRFRKAMLTEVETEFFAKAFIMDPFERWETVHAIKVELLWQGFDWNALSQGTLPNPLHQPVVTVIPARGRVGRA